MKDQKLRKFKTNILKSWEQSTGILILFIIMFINKIQLVSFCCPLQYNLPSPSSPPPHIQALVTL
jgi:hypothetical protein